MATTKATKATANKQLNNTSSAKEIEVEQKYRVKKTLDPNSIIPVKNGFQGILVYQSPKTTETFIWEHFGDEQDMELQELKNARNSARRFFENNWFLIDDPEVLEYLGVERFYKYALSYDGFEELFHKTPEEIEEIVSKLPEGQRKTVAYRAKQMIADGEIDSIKLINALEKALSTELIER